MNNPSNFQRLRPRERKRACKWFNYHKREHGAVILYLLLGERKQVTRVLGVSYTYHDVKHYLSTRFGEGCTHPYEWVGHVDEREIYVVTFKSNARRMHSKLRRILRRFLGEEPWTQEHSEEEGQQKCQGGQGHAKTRPWRTNGIAMHAPRRPFPTTSCGV